MSDLITEDQFLTPVVVNSKPELLDAIVGISREIRSEFGNRDDIHAGEMLNRVLEWEAIYSNKLDENELEVLSTFSLVLGTINYKAEKMITGKKEEIRKAKLESVETQQAVLRVVFSNLDEEGKPNESIMKLFSWECELFDEYLNPEHPKIIDKGIEPEAGYWQGILGMVTTAFLFKNAGWNIRLPQKEWDVDHDIDLIVKNKEGKVFTVDVTAKMPRYSPETGETEKAFYIKKWVGGDNLDFLPFRGLKGNIVLNVPPLRCPASYDFYSNRITAYPNEESSKRFSELIER